MWLRSVVYQLHLRSMCIPSHFDVLIGTQFVMGQGQWTLRDRVLTFIDIFLGLCSETIQFDRSMARPLVLNACYFKTNRWKDCCEQFIISFGRKVYWESVKATKSTKQGGKTVYTYVRDENRYLHPESCSVYISSF